jgi:hypothetical protein
MSAIAPGSVPAKPAGATPTISKTLLLWPIRQSGPPDDVGIARKAAAPVIVGENRDGTRAGFQVVGFRKKPAQSGTESEGTEHPSRNELSVGFLDFLCRSVRQIKGRSRGDRYQLRSILGVLLQRRTHLTELGIGESAREPRQRDSVKPFRIRDRQGPQKKCLDDAEDRGTCSDGQAER